MKKVIKCLCLLIISFCFINIEVFASVNTFTRTEDNLLVKDSINVTEYNKDIILATPAIDAKEKVYDFADLFTDSEEERLYEDIGEYINSYNMDLAVVTINDNNKLNAQEYAQDFYDYNDFRTDGVLFLIDMDTREIYMTTTGSAIDMYNDYRIDQILDSVYYYVSSGDYYDTASSFIDEVSYYASIGLPNDSNYGYSDKVIFADIFLKCFLIALVVTVIIMVILVMKNRMVKKATSSREYLVKETMKINHVSETFLGAFVSKVRRSHDSGSSGGGGGSSISSGSSGVSHGGGGRSF